MSKELLKSTKIKTSQRKQTETHIQQLRLRLSLRPICVNMLPDPVDSSYAVNLTQTAFLRHLSTSHVPAELKAYISTES